MTRGLSLNIKQKAPLVAGLSLSSGTTAICHEGAHWRPKTNGASQSERLGR